MHQRAPQPASDHALCSPAPFSRLSSGRPCTGPARRAAVLPPVTTRTTSASAMRSRMRLSAPHSRTSSSTRAASVRRRDSALLRVLAAAAAAAAAVTRTTGVWHEGGAWQGLERRRGLTLARSRELEAFRRPSEPVAGQILRQAIVGRVSFFRGVLGLPKRYCVRTRDQTAENIGFPSGPHPPTSPRYPRCVRTACSASIASTSRPPRTQLVLSRLRQLQVGQRVPAHA